MNRKLFLLLIVCFIKSNATIVLYIDENHCHTETIDNPYLIDDPIEKEDEGDEISALSYL